jgi:hypothetical protein
MTADAYARRLEEVLQAEMLTADACVAQLQQLADRLGNRRPQ